MALWQLANASAIYAVGFVLMMLMFVLLYARGYARRDAIGLTELRRVRAEGPCRATTS